MWKRALLFLSSIPVTILMNSFRIGTIGVMVEHWGRSMAEGFLHDFQGWAVFMTSAGVLLLEMMLLARIGKTSPPVARSVRFGCSRSDRFDRHRRHATAIASRRRRSSSARLIAQRVRRG